VAARVLRLSNSAYYSGGREISDLRTAVTRLGQNALRRLVLASEVFSVGPEADELRDRALRISQLAGKLLAGPSAELAATAGLLAEVGLLLPRSSGIDPATTPYTATGAYLLGLWGLPGPIVEAVAFHQRPAKVRGSFWVTGALHVAAALVNGREPDEAYLRSVGQYDRLPRWRDLAASTDAGCAARALSRSTAAAPRPAGRPRPVRPATAPRTTAAASTAAPAHRCPPRGASVVALVANLAAEHPVRPSGVRQDHRDQHHRADQHEHQAGLRRGRVVDGQRARHHVGKHADAQAQEGEREQAQGKQERLQLAPAPQRAPERIAQDRGQQRHLRGQQHGRIAGPSLTVVEFQPQRGQADRGHPGQQAQPQRRREPARPRAGLAFGLPHQPGRAPQGVADHHAGAGEQRERGEPVE